MRRVIWAPVLAALLLICGSAWAAPATVNLRVEGATSTIYEGPVTTDGKSIAGHPCDGTTRTTPPNPGPGPTMTSALDDASLAAGFGWTGAWNDAFGDFLIDGIASEQGSGGSYWGTVLNYEPTPVGGCQQQVAQGDEALFALGDVYGQPLLKLRGDTRAAVGEPLSLHVVNGATGDDFTGASVPGQAGETGADGRLTVSFDSPGVKTLKAQASGAIRSNAWQVCVEVSGSGTCGGFTSPLLVAPVSKVTDSSAPVARISSPGNGRKYRHGPRLLRGTASDVGSGVKQVKLALRKHVRGKGCQWWSGRRDRFVGRNCHKKFFFAIGSDANWSYLLPRALGAGHYVLDVKVFDAAGNRADVFRRGQNRTVFDVVPPARRVRSAGAPAKVEVMVVGKRRVIVKPGTVRAGETVVRASGRRCAVAASTPLAALVAALGRAKVGYAVRDYGSCTASSPRDSRQLFVKRIGRERNSGQDGWVYKVDDRAPNRGAADSRLRSGDRMVWLYCKQDPEAGGCQRSLRAVPAKKKSGLAGQSLQVRVLGYDDRRRKRPVPGATVSLTAQRKTITSAVTSADGSALLTLPGAGRYELAATAPGLVPSFPVRIRTR